MNISYIGATEDSNYKRFALIQYTEKEEEKAERFAVLLEQMNTYKWFGEEEMLYIEVDDKDDYNYVKYCFKSYKKTKMFNKTSKRISYEDMYADAETDAEMYCILVNEGHTESEIKDIMLEVSGGPDAYNNALETISAELF